MFLQLRDFLLAYDEAGEGLPVVFIHGYPLNRRMWAPQLASLHDIARLLAPDLRGHGESQAVPGPYSMDLLADDLVAFIEALKINQPVVLCGLSMGGYIALAFARRHSHLLAGLILTATRAGADSPEAKTNREKSADLARREGVAAIVNGILPKLMAPGTYTRQPQLVSQVEAILLNTSLEGVLGDLMGMKERPDSTPLLPQIAVPTLVVHGAEDQIIPLSEAEAMASAIPHASLIVLPDAGHLPNLEQPDLFNQAVRQFLQRLS